MSLDPTDAFAPIQDGETFASPRVAKVPLVPVPVNAPACRFRHPTKGRPVASWSYHDAEGRLVGYAARFEWQNESGSTVKDVAPITYCALGNGRQGWRLKGIPVPCPLYRLPALLADQGKPVLVVEGEKTAEAATVLFRDHVVTTSIGGGKAALRSDWSPLAGRDVVIWPDHDRAGRVYAEAVARIARQLSAASVRIVAVPEAWPAGWDLADAPPEGADLGALLASATEIEPATARAEPGVEIQFPYKIVRLAGGEDPPGVYHGREVEDKESGAKTTAWTWIASLVEPVAEARDAANTGWSRLIEVEDRDGHRHIWTMPMKILAGSGEEFRAMLLHLGAVLSPSAAARAKLTAFVQLWRPSRKVRCVPSIGWHGTAYILPNRVFGRPTEPVTLQADTPPIFELSGTYEAWQAEVAGRAVGNSRLGFYIAAAFAAPLLHLTDEESGGFHLKGGSSDGKSTCLRGAVSVWGVEWRTWRGTDNGIEGIAADSNDSLLALDEIGQAPARSLGEILYMLGNGTAKARMRSDATRRTLRKWRLLLLSTGEIGFAQKLAEAGIRSHAGQEVRIAEIPADAGAGLGVFQNLQDLGSGDTFAKHVTVSAKANQGHAALRWLEAIAGDSVEVGARIAAFQAAWLQLHVPVGSDGQVSRVAGRFALVAAAGKLATLLGILPWPDDEAERAALACFTAWLDGRGGSGSAELRDGVAAVRLFLEQHGSSRFEPAWIVEERDLRTVSRAGFRRAASDGEGWDYFVLPTVWRDEICKGRDARALARHMVEMGWLQPDGAGYPSRTQSIPGHGVPRIYHITPEFMR